MKRRFLPVALLLVGILCMMLGLAGAETSGDFTYTVVKTDGISSASVTGWSGSDTVLVIPETFDGLKVTMIAERAFRGNTTITSVTIPGTVTHVDDYAFQNCSNLRDLYLNEGLVTLDYCSFENCGNLTALSLPKTVKNIGSYAFKNCRNLASLSLNEGLTNLYYQCFYACKKLTEVTIPSTVASVGEEAFAYCEGIQELTLTEGMTAIGKNMFRGCTSLISVTIPSSVETVGNCAFCGCSSLRQAAFSEGLEVIGEYAFQNCITLRSLSFPKTLTSVNYCAFEGCVSLEEITFEGPTETIGSYAFKNCKVLKELVLPEGMKSVGYQAFYNCVKVESVTIPSTMTGIGEESFRYCNALKELTIKKGANGLGTRCFANCTGLTSLSLPASISNVGNGAFQECTGLEFVYFNNGTTSVGEYAFYKCTGLKAIHLPSTLTSVGYAAFEGCSNITNLTLNEGLTSVANYAFRNCTKIRYVAIPSTVTSIGYQAFYGCSGMKTLTLKNGCSGLGEYSFAYCTGLTSVHIPSSIKYISNRCFEGCTGLQKLTMDEGVTTIGYAAFYKCSGLTDIIFPFSLIELEAYAFESTTNLRTVTIPKSVVTIDKYAFYKSGLQTIRTTTGSTAASWGKGIFAIEYINATGFTLKTAVSPLITGSPVAPIVTVTTDEGTVTDRDDLYSLVSLNPSIVRIENKKLIPVKAGTATIELTGINGETVTCKVEVADASTGGNDVASFVKRCYQLILSRNADSAGLESWVSQLTAGTKTASEIIYGFMYSSEFTNRKLSGEDAVEILYKAMLNRSSDAPGKADWVGNLGDGASYTDIINGFCGSGEFAQLCAQFGINPGSVETEDPDKVAAFVKRCYKLILNRSADGEGLNTWVTNLKEGTKTASEIIYGFMYSDEYTNRKLSNEATIEIMYKTMLDRGSDEGGKADWLNRLANGQTIVHIINGFCGSQEFTGLCKSYGITPGYVKTEEATALNKSVKAVKAAPDAEAEVLVREDAAESEELLGEAVQETVMDAEKAGEFVGRCYRAALDREAGEAELQGWTDQIVSGEKSPDKIVRGFLFSDEFKARNLSDGEIVKILYRIYMNREADPEGLAFWTAKLAEGMSLEDAVKGFAASEEFKAILRDMKK